MTTIPDDIMQAAREVYDHLESPRPNDYGTPRAEGDIIAIAQAIAAKREPFAKVSERKHTHNVGMVHPMAASDAAAIRKGAA